MKHYGLNIAEGTQITNITVAQGTSFPTNENSGELFFRTDLSSLFVYDGTQWAEVGVGSGSEPSTYYYTAISDQTVFSGNDDNSASMTYFAGSIQVFLNGVLLDPADYTAVDGLTITLGVGTEAGDLLTVVALDSWAVNEAEIDGGVY